MNNWGRTIMAQLRTAINPVMDNFLSSTTLANARTALGVPAGSSSMTNFGNLTNSANGLPYMTGSDAWSTTTLTSFARTLLDDGDASAARTTLGAIGGASASASANSGSVSIPLTASFTLLIQWGTGTCGANSTGTVTFATAYSTAPACIVNGGSANAAAEGDIRQTGNPTTTGVSIINTSGDSATYNFIAIGKA